MRADRGGSESGLGRERERTGAGERGERGGSGREIERRLKKDESFYISGLQQFTTP